MRVLTPLAILVAGILIAAALVHQNRYRVWQLEAGGYLIHDSWRGDLAACQVEGTPPEVTVTCAAAAGTTH